MFLIKTLSFPYSVGDHELLQITPQSARAEASVNPGKKGNGKSSTGTGERMGRYSTVIRLFRRPFGTFIIHISWQN